MTSWEGKIYKLEKSENFDEYLEAIGVSSTVRKIASNNNSTIELKKDGDTYTLTTSVPQKSTSITFKLGEEFEYEVDGRKVPCVCTLEGHKLTQVLNGDKPSTIVRELTDTGLTTTLTIGDVVAVRTYSAA